MPRSFHLPMVLSTLALLVACGGAEDETGGTGGGGGGGGGGTPTAPATTLAASTSHLVLAASGRARKLIFTNTGSQAVQALTIQTIGLPIDSNTLSSCGTTLGPGATCEVTVTPGPSPSAAVGNHNPVPATLRAQSSNAPAITVNLTVLSHGSVHQAGYVFAIDDTRADHLGIGGKVIGLTEAGPMIWSDTLDNIAGINENSVAGPGSCAGSTDGQCDTALIRAQYPNPGSPDSQASTLCSNQSAGGYQDWYLPAACEINVTPNEGTDLCGTVDAPVLADNVASRIGHIALPDHLVTGRAYWSSTQSSVNPNRAYRAVFQIGTTASIDKNNGAFPTYVRCARAITP